MLINVLRLLLFRMMPGRLGWVIAAWLIFRILARRQAASPARMPVTARRVN